MNLNLNESFKFGKENIKRKNERLPLNRMGRNPSSQPTLAQRPHESMTCGRAGGVTLPPQLVPGFVHWHVGHSG